MISLISSSVNPFCGLRSVVDTGSPGSTLITTNVNTYARRTTTTAWPVRRSA